MNTHDQLIKDVVRTCALNLPDDGEVRSTLISLFVLLNCENDAIQADKYAKLLNEFLAKQRTLK